MKEVQVRPDGTLMLPRTMPTTQEEEQDHQTTLNWEFAKKPLKEAGSNCNTASKDSVTDEPDVVHHLANGRDNIYENSLDEKDGQSAAAGNVLPLLGGFQSPPQKQVLSDSVEHSTSNEPPYCVFNIHMDSLTDASIRLKIW